MHIKQFALSYLLIGVTFATPLSKVARQAASQPAIPNLGALPPPSVLFRDENSIIRRSSNDNNGGGDDERGQGRNHNGGAMNPEGGWGGFRANLNSESGSPWRDGNGQWRDRPNVVVVEEPQPVKETPPKEQQQQQQQQQASPPSPAPAPAPAPAVPVAAASPWTDHTAGAAPVSAAAPIAPLAENIRAAMMPMVLKLGCVTPFQKAPMMVLPRVNTIDQGKRPGQ